MGTAEQARALLHWRIIGKKVLEFIGQFEASQMDEARESAWLTGGSGAGLSQQCYAEGLPAQLHPMASSNDQHLETSIPPTFKQEQYAQAIKSVGIFQGLRKCAKPATAAYEKCSHPTNCLAGAGNAVQREVWCQNCHARWKVASVVPKTAAKTEPWMSPPRMSSTAPPGGYHPIDQVRQKLSNRQLY